MKEKSTRVLKRAKLINLIKWFTLTETSKCSKSSLLDSIEELARLLCTVSKTPLPLVM